MSESNKAYLKRFEKKSAVYWESVRISYQSSLYKKMISGVPAFRNFLREANVASKDLHAGFDSIPAMDKKKYFRRYEYPDLFYAKTFLRGGFVGTATSGSTGKPTYFLRNKSLEEQYAFIIEQFLSRRSGTTLFIDCFGMGVWIGGILTYQAAKTVSERIPGITVFTPGIHVQEIAHILNSLAHLYDSVVLAGYPPFIKDLLDELSDRGIAFEKGKYRLLFAAESFSESFRDYVAAKAKIKNVFLDTMNIYGSAELGAMAFESPFSICARRILLASPRAYKDLFEEHKTPTLAQYIPDFIQFEQDMGRVLISADSAMPCFRYNIGDYGGVYGFVELVSRAKSFGIDLTKLAKKNRIPIYTLPFVYVYERLDFTTKLYGAIIYPEHVREALGHHDIKRVLTGKFMMTTKSGKKHEQYLEINIELSKDAKNSRALVKQIETIVTHGLLQKNAEYKNNYQSMSKRMIPKVILWPHAHPTYFKQGIKQKWVL
jgi:phenylacetate-CoA ligase